MIRKHLDCVSGDSRCGVVVTSWFDGRQSLIVESVLFGTEVAVMVVERIGVIEASRQHIPVHVPLAGMIRAVAQWLQEFRQQPGPWRTPTVGPATAARQGVASHLLGVIPGENARSRRPASSRVVELSEAQTAAGTPIEVRGW